MKTKGKSQQQIMWIHCGYLLATLGFAGGVFFYFRYPSKMRDETERKSTDIHSQLSCCAFKM